MTADQTAKAVAEDLKARGFIYQTSDDLEVILTDRENKLIYLGVDPTGDSLHVGHLVTYIFLKHLVTHGYKIICLIGGATGMIGDPKPTAERQLLPPEVIDKNVRGLEKQINKLLGTDDIIYVNNHDWLGKIDLITFLRDIGKHFSVNTLVKKEAIAARMEGETGISYTEFSYPLLQAYDYLHLAEQHGCNIQIGGSDQWGNIIAGIDLVRKRLDRSVYGMTLPLLVDKKTGRKFGKSEDGTVWLDADKTTPYSFYQFWLNVADDEVEGYLKLFTLMTLEEITQIMQESSDQPELRIAQRKLALAVTALVHNTDSAEAAAAVSEIMFGKDELENLSNTAKEILLTAAPVLEIKSSMNLIDVLVESELASSNSEARRLIEGGSVSINNKKISDLDYAVDGQWAVNGLMLLKKGKKHKCVLSFK